MIRYNVEAKWLGLVYMALPGGSLIGIITWLLCKWFLPPPGTSQGRLTAQPGVNPKRPRDPNQLAKAILVAGREHCHGQRRLRAVAADFESRVRFAYPLGVVGDDQQHLFGELLVMRADHTVSRYTSSRRLRSTSTRPSGSDTARCSTSSTRLRPARFTSISKRGWSGN